MYDSDANITKIEPTLASHDNQFMVASRLEITQILLAIMRAATLVTATVDDHDFFLTSLLAVDENTDSLFLERSRSALALASTPGSRKLLCSTTLDKVQIRFACSSITAANYSGSEAYQAPLPTELLRIQRREFYRIETPIASPVKCTVFTDDRAKDTRLELNLCDISCGGIAVQSPPALFTPELGAYYKCIIMLPGTPGQLARIQARNAFMVTLPSGKITQRSGFAFVDPPENVLAAVQRYILKLEQQRRTSGRHNS